MRVKVGGKLSEPLDVHGECPQGSLLGLLIFNISPDNIECGPDYRVEQEMDNYAADTLTLSKAIQTVIRIN